MAGLILLSACVPAGVPLPGPYGEEKPFGPTRAEQREIVLIAHANAIARKCPLELMLNKPERDKVLRPLVERAQASGHRILNAEELVGMPRSEARAIGLAYEKERGIVASRKETWCAAGHYEVKNRTGVGKYLIDRLF